MYLKPKPRRRPRSGAAAVEMAAVLPLVIALVFGQIESSRLGMMVQLLNTAAREGCRVAVISGHTANDVKARVNAVLSGSGVSFSSVTPSPSNWDTAPGGTAITVSLSVPYSQVGWLPTPRFLRNATVKASATFSSERY
jgi:Flp pilus assembly protein TadG